GDSRVAAAHYGDAEPPKRTSTDPYLHVISDLQVGGWFRCADGKWCVLHPGTRGTKIWAHIAEVLGREDFLTEEGYEPGTRARAARRREVIGALISGTGARPRKKPTDPSTHQQTPTPPAYTISDAMSDAQLRERNMFVDVDDEELGSIRLVAPAPRL